MTSVKEEIDIELKQQNGSDPVKLSQISESEDNEETICEDAPQEMKSLNDGMSKNDNNLVWMVSILGSKKQFLMIGF